MTQIKQLLLCSLFVITVALFTLLAASLSSTLGVFLVVIGATALMNSMLNVINKSKEG